MPLQGVAQAQGLGRGLGEIRIDRIELLDARHQRRLALPDQRALGHQRAADAPGDRRSDRGVAEVQARGLQVGLGRAGRRLGAAQVGGGGIEVLLADRLDLHQRLVATHPRLRLEQHRAVPRQLTLGARHRSLQRCRIDLEQQVASLDVGALLEALPHDDAGHPRAHLGDTHRFDPPRQFRTQRQGLGLHRQDLHRQHHFGGLLSLFRRPTTRQRDGHSQRPDPSYCTQISHDTPDR